MKLLVREEGSDELLEPLARASVVATVAIAHVELRAAIASMHRARRLSAPILAETRLRLALQWARTSPINVDDGLIEDAGELAEKHALRGYDAVHLAGLRRLGRPGSDLIMAVWDERLRQAAAAEGYGLFPPGRT